MLSAKLFLALAFLPVFVFCYKCAVSDTSSNNGVSTCDSTNFCVTNDEYNQNGQWTKTVRQCDFLNCRSNGKHSVYNQASLSVSTFDCCTGDYCNSATNKGLLALPVMILTYVLFK